MYTIPHPVAHIEVRKALLVAKDLAASAEPLTVEQAAFITAIYDRCNLYGETARKCAPDDVGHSEHTVDLLEEIVNLAPDVRGALTPLVRHLHPGRPEFGGGLVTDGFGPTAYGRQQSPTTSESK